MHDENHAVLTSKLTFTNTKKISGLQPNELGIQTAISFRDYLGKLVNEWEGFSDFVSEELLRVENEMLKKIRKNIKLVVKK